MKKEVYIKSREHRRNLSIALTGNKNGVGHRGFWLGKKMPLEVKKKMSDAKSGKKQSLEHIKNASIARKGWKHSEQTKKHLSLVKRGTMKGAKNHLWKGGISPLNKVIRSSFEYKQWRKSVFKRDNHTCQECGVKGGYLNADHIKPFAHFPKLRLSLSNGRTLCVPCHEKTDTYKGRAIKNYA